MSPLLRGFIESVHRYPKRPALYLDDRRWTYEELSCRAESICEAIKDNGLCQSQFVGLCADQSLTAYAGILGILATGLGFVPIDPHHPPQRIYSLIEGCELDTLVVGPEALDRLDGLLTRSGRPLAVIAPEVEDLRGLAARHPRHRFTTRADLVGRRSKIGLPRTSPSAPMCLLFASMSAPNPRAVPITHRNGRALLDGIGRIDSLKPEDRVSHTFALTFEASLYDLFSTWSSGAALVPWTSTAGDDPARFIQHHRLTRWSCIPTVAITMERLGQLTPRAFPNLRSSLFCGGLLAESTASAWAQAAPNSSIVNLYGHAETTVAIGAYRWEQPDSRRHCRRGLVPLGHIFDGQNAMVIGADGCPVSPGGRGQLLLSGSQVAPGYFENAGATMERFTVLPGHGPDPWFQTGDLVEVDDEGRLHFVARLDDQIQLRGHRVELNEIDRVLRRACGHDKAICVPWPRDRAGVYGLVAFVESDEPVDFHHLLADCRRNLPHSIIPDRVITRAELPLNPQGDLDRCAIQRLLEEKEI